MAALSSPQPLVVGEATQKDPETILNHTTNQSYASHLMQKQAATKIAKLELCPVTFVHGEPRVEFTVEEVNQFTIEEGLHQAVIVKFSYGKPELQEFRKIFAKQFDIKGYCNIGQLEYRHLLVRFDSFDDYVQFVSRSAGYIKSKGDEFFFRTFPWTLGFNPKEETSKSVVWISFPDLPPNFFAKKSLMSIASAIGKPLSVDKATQDRTRPSAARVKVLLDLLDKHPKEVKIHIVDKATGKSVEFYQMVVYDNLPKYCTCCNHQGHAEETCHWKIDESKDGADVVDATEGIDGMDKLQGTARTSINVKSNMQQSGDARKEVLIDQQKIQSTGKARALSDPMGNSAGKNILAQVNQCVKDQAVFDPKDKNAGKKLLSHVAQGVKISKTGQRSAVYRAIEGTSMEKITGRGEKSSETSMDGGHLESASVKAVGQLGCTIENEGAEESAFAFVQINAGVQNTKEKVTTSDGHVIEMEMDAGHGGKVGDIVSVQQLKNNVVGQIAFEINKNIEESAKENEKGMAQNESRFTTEGNKSDTNGKCTTVFERKSSQKATNKGHGDIMDEKGLKAGHVAEEKVTAKKEKAVEKEQLAENPSGHLNKNSGHTFNKIVVVGSQVHDGNESKGNGGHVKEKLAENNGNTTQMEGHAGSLIEEKSGASHLNDNHVGQLCLTKNAENLEQKDLCVVTERAGRTELLSCNAQLFATTTTGKQNTFDSATEGGKQKNASVDTAKATIARAFLAKNTNDNAAALSSAVNRDAMHHGEYVADSQQLAIVPVDEQMTGAVNHTDSKEVELMASSSNVPTLHYSSPHVENIIKEAQAAMVRNTSMVKQPFVTLNTSVYEVPSQSMGSYGGESGQQLLSTGNNNVGDKERDPDNVFDVESTHDGADQQSEGEISIGSPSGTGKELTLNPNNPTASASTSGARNLSRAANIRELVTNSKLWDQQREEDDEEDYGNGFEGYESEENEQQVDYESAGEDLDAPNTANTTSLLEFHASAAIAASPKSTLNHNAPVFVPRNNASKPVNSSVISGSNGRENRSRGKLINVEQKSHNATLAKMREGNNMVTQVGHDMPNSILVGRDTYEEGEEDDIINQCRAVAARRGDLSPMHSGKNKKSRTSDRSWDGRQHSDRKATQEIALRIPPMRNAKQKASVSTTSARSNKSQKK